MNALRKLINRYIPNRAVVTAGQICIDLTLEGYDDKTLGEFLNRFEEAVTGEKMGKPVK